jgi:predicted metal-dependent peptidase
LQQFRAHILAQHRLLTRMKPNRRYGWDYAGSRRAFTTRLLFAVDVSGSISDEDLQRGFSIVNQFFKYGIEKIDVMQFDTEIKGPPVQFKKVKCCIDVVGRGGTCFQPILDYLGTDAGSCYDGLIIFTDGITAMPKPPKNRHTRILWLFNHERYYLRRARGLEQIGSLAYLKNDPYAS